MDLLYSTDKVDFENILKQKEMNHATALKMKEPQFWLNLMNETFTLPRVVLKGAFLKYETSSSLISLKQL